MGQKKSSIPPLLGLQGMVEGVFLFKDPKELEILEDNCSSLERYSKSTGDHFFLMDDNFSKDLKGFYSRTK